MRKLTLALIVACCFCFQAYTEKPGFTLTGKIEGLGDVMIYMKYAIRDSVVTDSVTAKKGVFKFQGRIADPMMAMLYSPAARFQKIFYIENVSMQLAGTSSGLDKLVVSGSKTQDEYAAHEANVNKRRAEVNAAGAAAAKAKEEGDTVAAKKFADEQAALTIKERGLHKQFAVEHPKSFVSLDELRLWIATNMNRDLNEVNRLYAGLDASIKDTYKGKELLKYIMTLEEVQLGKPAIDFTQPDVNGKDISLSSYKGKYVLIEFWASWCGPCRAENPHLRSEYMKYKDKGLNILAVSLDNNADKWKEAVVKDDLPWPQVCDLKGWNNQAARLYAVQGVPANFLVDPDGKIIAKDLRGDSLTLKLAEVFDKSLKH